MVYCVKYLPTEIFWNVFDYIDLNYLYKYKLTNKRFMQMIKSFVLFNNTNILNPLIRLKYNNINFGSVIIAKQRNNDYEYHILSMCIKNTYFNNLKSLIKFVDGIFFSLKSLLDIELETKLNLDIENETEIDNYYVKLKSSFMIKLDEFKEKLNNLVLHSTMIFALNNSLSNIKSNFYNSDKNYKMFKQYLFTYMILKNYSVSDGLCDTKIICYPKKNISNEKYYDFYTYICNNFF